MIHRQSDPPIVLGDGSAAYEGKGWAGRLPEQSTHWERKDCLFPRNMSRSLLKLLLRDRSEEPGAGKPHAGICEGAAR
jgi:hypothetical protein